MKLKRLVGICLAVTILGALLFFPVSSFQESHSVSPTGTEKLIALTQRAISQTGANSSSTGLLIENSSGKRALWFRCENSLFQPSDYVWSKDGSLIAAKLVWSATAVEKGFAQGKDYLKSVDVANGVDYSVGNIDSLSPATSAAQLQMIPQLLKKRGGAINANWSAPKKISWFQLFALRRE